MTNEIRKIDLSNKLMEIGKALITEGQQLQDYTIAQSGTIVTLISSLMLVDEDMFIFAELCAMFSAKKILDSISVNDKSEIAQEIKDKVSELVKKITPQDIPEVPKKKRIRKPRNGGKKGE